MQWFTLKYKDQLQAMALCGFVKIFLGGLVKIFLCVFVKIFLCGFVKIFLCGFVKIYDSVVFMELVVSYKAIIRSSLK